MIRRPKVFRLRPRIEPLEVRAMLSTTDTGMWPLPNPGADNSILMRFSATATPAQEQSALSALRASVVKTYPDGPELIRLGEGIDVNGAIKSLSSNREVLYAQADTTIHAAAASVYPDDPSFSQEYGLNNANNVDIDAPEAWATTTGTSSTIVAVIDSGIDLTNPDFAGKIWTNPGNDAAEGYPNDIHGWNFVGNNNNVEDDDSDGHGTHVSGTIAAAGNDNYGVVGVDWQAQIMPIKFLDSTGSGSTDNAVSAIYYAVDHGARVINASWGGVDALPALNDAIAYANAHNVVFVTAAGNDGTNNDVVASYPSSFRQPNELSVAAVNSSGQLADFSNYGATTVDVAAPGVDIISDAPAYVSTTRLQTLSGTSMSTAFVSGVAALVVGQNPSLTAVQIVQIIDSTAKSLPSLAGKTISGGIVDAAAAVAAAGVTIGGNVPSAGLPTLTPGASTVEQVHSSILASDEYFADQGGTAQGFITGLYENLLDRLPDSAGLAYWVSIYSSGLVSRYQIANAILTTPEARLTEVAHFFQDDLGRTASIDELKEDAGVAVWANLIDNRFGDDTVEAAIMSSYEYLVGHGATPPTVVEGYYADLLERTAGSNEVAGWSDLLYQGLAPFTVLREFQGSAEVEQTKVARWFAEDLGRAESVADLKDDAGVDAFAATLGNF